MFELVNGRAYNMKHLSKSTCFCIVRWCVSKGRSWFSDAVELSEVHGADGDGYQRWRVVYSQYRSMPKAKVRQGTATSKAKTCGANFFNGQSPLLLQIKPLVALTASHAAPAIPPHFQIFVFKAQSTFRFPVARHGGAASTGVHTLEVRQSQHLVHGM